MIYVETNELAGISECYHKDGENSDIHIVVSPHYSRKYEIIEYEYRIATYFDFLEKPFKWRKSKEYYEIYEQCFNAGILEALKLILL